ncbi:hypothetical protein WEI85_37465 [Actinomycetes bacterium KLBMP 9797]
MTARVVSPVIPPTAPELRHGGSVNQRRTLPVPQLAPSPGPSVVCGTATIDCNGRLTEAAVIPALRPRRTPVPLEWFQQNYINTGKTIRQAAAEAGVSRNTFSKYARLHNIPPARRPRDPIESLPPK